MFFGNEVLYFQSGLHLDKKFSSFNYIVGLLLFFMIYDVYLYI